MNAHTFNTSPWDDDADGTFFSLTATLFSTSYTGGASVLLASYDPDDDVATPSLAVPDRAQQPATVTAKVSAWARWAQS